MKRKGLVPDLDGVDEQGAGALVRFGLIGRGSRAGRWRLYTSPDLTDYLEFAEADAVSVTPVSRVESPLGGSIVSFKAGAKLQRVSTRSLEEQSSFLKGPVTSGFLPLTRDFNFSAGGFSPETIIVETISYLVACPSHWLGCTARCTVGGCGGTMLGFCTIYSLFCTYEKRICG
jgi:hypothetical protein